MTSPTVGILAGMGPFSTGPFLDMVATECQRQYGARHDADFPRLMVCSQPAPFYEDRPTDHAALEAAIRDGLRRLEETGAAFLAMACNTAHIYYPSLAAGLRVPLLDMVELAVAALPRGAQTVAVMAARPTAECGLYQRRLATRGFSVVEGGWQDDVDRMLAATRTSREPVVFATFWTGLLARAQALGVDTVLVASIDLSGVLSHAVTTLRVVDAAQALAEEVVAQWRIRRDG